jgi:hypothetical protein
MFFPLHNFNGGGVAEEDTWAAAPPIGTDLDTTGMGKLLIIKRKKKRIEETAYLDRPSGWLPGTRVVDCLYAEGNRDFR